MLKASETKRLKPKCDTLVSSYAFNLDLRRYNKEIDKRLIKDKIVQIKKKVEKVSMHRAQYRGRRAEAGGLLRTTSRTVVGVLLTFRVNAYASTRRQCVEAD
jgi:hypothetical protein